MEIITQSGKYEDLVSFNKETCRFNNIQNSTDFSKKLSKPLSVIFQITRRCHFSCIFCSESEQMQDPSIEEIEMIKANLLGVNRIFLSGGEPLIRKDFPEILDIFSDEFIIGVPTNAIASPKLMPHIIEKVDFVNIGLDGPRNITSKIRGDYELIMNGAYSFKEAGVPLSITSVVLRSTVDSILYTCQIADTLEARKIKLIIPIKKGNALEISDNEYLTHDECIPIFNSIKEQKNKLGWRPEITFTTWKKENEGYSILVYPDGSTYAWPVYHTEDKTLYLGNVKNEKIEAIWERYPYKDNHIQKYVGDGVLKC